MRLSRTTWLVPVFLSLGAQSIQAQEQSQQRHNGFWVGFGLGGGWNTYANVEGISEAGLGVYARLGGTISRRLLLGGETAAWVDAQTTAGVARANATFTAMFYPLRNGGLYLKGGLGIAKLQIASVTGALGSTSQTGIGSTWGIGYDIRVGGNLYLTPNIDVLIQSFDNNESQTTNTITLFTLGLVWH